MMTLQEPKVLENHEYKLTDEEGNSILNVKVFLSW